MTAFQRAEPFTALADVYQAAGFAGYSQSLIPKLYELLFGLDWTGRVALDLACGTGEAACWLAQRGLRVTGVDISSAMLRHAHERADAHGLSAEFAVGDMRAFRPHFPYDLITCLGRSLNYIPSLRDLELIFKMAYAALEPGKYFIFDIATIQGLARTGQADRLVSDDEETHLIVAREFFSYETLTLTTQYTIFRWDAVASWQRADEVHVLRGYPVQAITRLLENANLRLLHTLTADMEPAENRRDVEQLVFMVQREA